jgi:hypothetical protein
MATSETLCPRCGIGRLKRWSDLTLEEQMVAHKLPHSANFAHDERTRLHRWCTKCWYEDDSRETTLA